MSTSDRLVEQHIKAYYSRLKHIDDMFEQTERLTRGSPSPLDAEIASLRLQRDSLVAEMEAIEKASEAQWQIARIEQVGPMVIWDIVATKLGSILDRLEQRTFAD